MMDQAKPAESLVRVSLDGQEDFFPKGMPLLEILKRLLPKRAPQVLCCLCGGLCVELGQPIDRDCCLTSLTYLDEEGRRIYERSLQFIFLTAAHRLYPGKRVRIRHSFVQGLYIDLPEVAVTEEIVARLKAEMRRPLRSKDQGLARQAGPFCKKGEDDDGQERGTHAQA